jgi:hypothetical protein
VYLRSFFSCEISVLNPLDHAVVVLERDTENIRKELIGRCKKTAWVKKRISDRKEFN